MRIPVNFLLLSFVGAIALAACNKKSEAPTAPAAPSTKAAVVGAPAKLAVGDKTRCPVTGEEFVVSANTVQVEHEGKHYAFCCADCQPSFEKDPAKYIKKN